MALLLQGCASGGTAGSGFSSGLPQPVRQEIDGILSEAPVDQAHWGIHVVDLETGAVLLDRNAARKFVPASNQKIPVTAAGLTLLGPDHRWTTEVWLAGGRLVVIGSGDPTLGPPFFDGAGRSVETLADSITAALSRRAALSSGREGAVQPGLTPGPLGVDASAFDSTTVPGSWMVQNLPWAYSATGGAFVVDRGELLLEVEDPPGEEAGPAVRSTPLGRPEFVENRIRSVLPGSGAAGNQGSGTETGNDPADGLEVVYLPESRRVVVQGIWPDGASGSLRVAARDPVRQSARVLEAELARRGLPVEGILVAWDSLGSLPGGCLPRGIQYCPGAVRLVQVVSPPLLEVVREILGASQNWLTEQLLLTLGLEGRGVGSRENGLQVVHEYVTAVAGADSLDFDPRDGSGLSAYNLITPRAVTAILSQMWRSSDGSAYLDALAEPGEEGTTLDRRLLDLQGRLHAKTGTINHVNALSGYLHTASGRPLAFSILTNGSGLPSPPVRQAMDRVVRALAEMD